MHLTLNTAAVFDNVEPKLITYEKKGYCALVPVPKIKIFRIFLFMPFDVFTWMFLAVSIISSTVVWRMYQNHGAVDSHWKFFSGILQMFLQLGTNFSQNNHFILLVLLQLTLYSVLFLSIAYESAITSTMIEPILTNRLQTVEDLINSKYMIATEDGIKSRISKLDIYNLDTFELQVIQQHFVFITACDFVDNSLKLKLSKGQHLSEYYYKLPEIISWDYVGLEASYLNPFLERLQFYMDLSFQAGLPNMWKVFEDLDESGFRMNRSSQIMSSLRYKELFRLFRMLTVALGISTVLFILEIFHHGCVQHLTVGSVMKFIRNCLNKIRKKSKTSKVKVKKINVKPKKALVT
ncbi:unnamed protein product [Chironomus riparius]|uniref:Uncharacterized protein n=1 Tax=Chironomus riparius TaxID=315576 RepID=A0A9N9WY68_9DIPT|nr:unnamed protein product [Chironomus riparius]